MGSSASRASVDSGPTLRVLGAPSTTTAAGDAPASATTASCGNARCGLWTQGFPMTSARTHRPTQALERSTPGRAPSMPSRMSRPRSTAEPPSSTQGVSMCPLRAIWDRRRPTCRPRPRTWSRPWTQGPRRLRRRTTAGVRCAGEEAVAGAPGGLPSWRWRPSVCDGGDWPGSGLRVRMGRCRCGPMYCRTGGRRRGRLRVRCEGSGQPRPPPASPRGTDGGGTARGRSLSARGWALTPLYSHGTRVPSPGHGRG